MAQITNAYAVQTHTLYARNIDLSVYSAFENIILDEVSVLALSNFAILVKNKSSVGNITKVSVYISPNKVDYYLLEDNILLSSVPPQTIGYVNFTAISLFLRVTVESDADINIDLHLHGNMM